MTEQLSLMTPSSNSATTSSHSRAFFTNIPQSFLIGSIAGCLALTVYLITIAPDLTWANYSSDGGELVTASVTLGIAHPPGYPTYILLGKLFSILPVGTIAYRFNLFSSVAMAVAISFATATAFALLAGPKPTWPSALAAGLCLAFSPLVWSQAVVAEVYALNFAFLSIFLWSLLTKRSSWLTGITLGLAMTAHLTSILMLPMAVALTPRVKIRQLLAGIIIGLSPLLLLPLLARLNSPVIWGDPSSFEGWWWLISAQLYRANIHFPFSSSSFFSHLSPWSSSALAQFAWIGWIFVILGIMANNSDQKRYRWLLASAAFYAVFSILYNTDDAILFLLPALLLLIPILAHGLTRLRYWSLLLPLLLLVVNFQVQNQGSAEHIRPTVERVLGAIPENSIIITPGDHSIFTLWYFHHIEDIRRDLILVDENLLAFGWYRQRLAVRYPDLDGLLEDNVPLFRAQNLKKRPICNLTLQTPLNTECFKPDNLEHERNS